MAHKFVGFDTFRIGRGQVANSSWRERDVNLLTTTGLDYGCQCVCDCVLSRIDCYFIYKKAPFKVQLCAHCFLPT